MGGRMIAGLAAPAFMLRSRGFARSGQGAGFLNIGVVGTGYVGLVVGACLAENGNSVVCVDADAAKVDRIRTGEIPIYEPGLNEMVPRNVAEDRLRFSTDLDEAVRRSEVIFIAVGTPQDEDGSADLTHVLDVARGIGRAMNGYKVVVNKSTVPVGTAAKVRDVIASLTEHPFAVVSNPGVPEGRHRRRRLPEARPCGDRYRRSQGRGHHAAALRAVREDRQADPGDGPGLGGADQVRRERDAGDSHLVHERDRELLRSRRRGREAGADGHGHGCPDRSVVPVSRRGLRRLLLPEGREGADPHGAGGRGRPQRGGGRGPHERGAEVDPGASDRRAPRGPGGQDDRGLGPRVQAADRRHARGARDRDRGATARGRCVGAGLRPEGGEAGATAPSGAASCCASARTRPRRAPTRSWS